MRQFENFCNCLAVSLGGDVSAISWLACGHAYFQSQNSNEIFFYIIHIFKNLFESYYTLELMAQNGIQYVIFSLLFCIPIY